MSGIRIDRCVCERKTFRDLLERARRDSLDVAGLCNAEGCGTHCGWCVAYLRRGLSTGESEFGEILPKEAIEP